MNAVLLYLLLLKATLISFSGLTSLPIVHNDFVVKRHVLTERQLTAAVAAGRTAPGPNGSYLVAVGYFIDGIPGACAGCMAVMTPAFLIIPFLRYVGRRAEHPRVKSAIQTITIAAGGLVVAATVPLARQSITGLVPMAIMIATFVYLTFARGSTLWVMVVSAAAGLAAALV